MKQCFWANKRVLVTGHTGFKGAWLSLWLKKLGAQVTGISLAPNTSPNLFAVTNLDSTIDSRYCDIRQANTLATRVSDAKPEIVFHLAACALVRVGFREPMETFSANTQGTVNVLEALRLTDSARVIIAVTTDKVYEPASSMQPYCESDTLGGHDPYSASKAAAELAISCYRNAYFAARGTALASARAGNVIGGGDWAEDRLIPDAIRAWSCNEILQCRNPQAVRPWQHVLDPLAGYLTLAEVLWDQPKLAGPYNFGPDSGEGASVRDVILLAKNAFGCGEVHFSADALGPPETQWLRLDSSKARKLLGTRTVWPLETAILRTMQWYARFREGDSAVSLCAKDIAEFEVHSLSAQES